MKKLTLIFVGIQPVEEPINVPIIKTFRAKRLKKVSTMNKVIFHLMTYHQVK